MCQSVLQVGKTRVIIEERYFFLPFFLRITVGDWVGAT
jgi:hypothetical protein